MRTPVHPDGHCRAVFPPADGPGDRRAVARLRFIPDSETEWPDHDVAGRVCQTHTLGLRYLRWRVTQCPCAGKFVERNSKIIDRSRSGAGPIDNGVSVVSG